MNLSPWGNTMHIRQLAPSQLARCFGLKVDTPIQRIYIGDYHVMTCAATYAHLRTDPDFAACGEGVDKTVRYLCFFESTESDRPVAIIKHSEVDGKRQVAYVTYKAGFLYGVDTFLVPLYNDLLTRYPVIVHKFVDQRCAILLNRQFGKPDRVVLECGGIEDYDITSDYRVGLIRDRKQKAIVVLDTHFDPVKWSTDVERLSTGLNVLP